MDARLLAIAVGNFITATGAFVVVGLLNEISADLGVSVAIAGLLAAGFAISSAVMAPIVAILGTRISRRALLVGALSVNAFSSLASAIAPSFAVLFGLRMLMGGTVGSYVPASVSTAGMLMPVERRANAVFVVGLGASLGQVIGVPAGVWLGGHFGWRTTFLVFGTLGVATCVFLWRMLPGHLRAAQFDLTAFRELTRNRAILWTLAVTALQGGAGFVTMSFIAPLLRERIGATPDTISVLLGLFGLCGVIASLIAMRVMERVGPTRLAMLALGAIALNFLIWPFAQGSTGLIALAVALWGAGFIVVASAQQSRLVLLDPKLAPVSVAFNTTCVFGGSALGTTLGSVTVRTAGLDSLTWISLTIVLSALTLLVATAPRRAPRGPSPA
jgi:predicted MFS family arabinose efflux permease